jgi:hypothetical protein
LRKLPTALRSDRVDEGQPAVYQMKAASIS